jgi:hypothetical protein
MSLVLLLLLLLLPGTATRAPGWTHLLSTGVVGAMLLASWSGAAAASQMVTAQCCGPRNRWASTSELSFSSCAAWLIFLELAASVLCMSVWEWGGYGLTNGYGTVLWPKEQVGGNACFCVRHRLCMFACVSAWFVRGNWAVVA